MNRHSTVWLFDLDNTLHDASHAAFGPTNLAMTQYIVDHLGFEPDAASRLRQHYWTHYGATLLGLVRHHGVKPAHFLEATHRLPGLEQRLRTSAHDRAALARLRGRRYVLTNAPRAYTRRVLDTLDLGRHFDGVISIEDMTMFGHPRPKPDARMLRHVAAHALGMKTAWMQRYLGGRYRGPLRNAANHGARPGQVGVHPCPKPPYVYAKIKSLLTLRALR
jgi:putative hydrolase of the HAD superfamily